LAALTLAPGQDGLKLSNVRATHGLLGPVRTEKKILPGDSAYICFDIEGITATEGKAQYGIVTEITDPKGKTILKEETGKLEAPLSLGGNTLPAFSKVDIGLEQPAGKYTLKLVVTDRAANKTATFSHDFEIADRGFGLVRFATTRDQQGLTPIHVPGPGDSMWLQFHVVGFDREKGKQPNVAVELQILDDKDKVVSKQSGVINKDVPDGVTGLPIQFLLSLNRPGKFTLVVSATDQGSKKTAKATLPLNVVSPK
jgi:hypothetical protein